MPHQAICMRFSFSYWNRFRSLGNETKGFHDYVDLACLLFPAILYANPFFATILRKGFPDWYPFFWTSVITKPRLHVVLLLWLSSPVCYVFSHRSVVLRFFYIASISKRTLLWFCIFCFAWYPAIWTACYGKLGALCRRYCCFSNIWIGNVWIVAVCHYSCSWLSSALLWMFGSRKELKNKKVGMGRRSRGPHERIT